MDYTWYPIPGSPYYDERCDEMPNVSELTDLELLVHLSVAEDQIYAAKKVKYELLDEIRSRKEALKDRLRREEREGSK